MYEVFNTIKESANLIIISPLVNSIIIKQIEIDIEIVMVFGSSICFLVIGIFVAVTIGVGVTISIGSFYAVLG